MESRRATTPNSTEWSAAVAQQFLVRYGIVTREAAASENLPGGFSAIYPTLRTMEESGLIRRGMFVAGLGAAQFAMNAAVDMLRTLRNLPEHPETVHLASVDPANPYGAILPWPRKQEGEADQPVTMLARTAGASVVLVNGALTAYFRRNNSAISVFLPENEPDFSQTAFALSRKLAEIAVARQSRRGGLLVREINGMTAREHPLGRFLEEAGFVETSLGFQMRRSTGPARPEAFEEAEEKDEEEAEAEEEPEDYQKTA